VGSGKGSVFPDGAFCTVASVPSAYAAATATPAPGYSFAKWVSGTPAAPAGSIASPLYPITAVAMTWSGSNPRAIAAEFTCDVRIEVDQAEGGTAELAQGWDGCLTPTGANRVIATPANDYSFDGWEIDDPSLATVNSDGTIAKSEPVTGTGHVAYVTPVFKPACWALTVISAPSSGGTAFRADSDCKGPGDTSVLIAIPNELWAFAGWEDVSGGSIDQATNTYTYGESLAQSITARFNPCVLIEGTPENSDFGEVSAAGGGSSEKLCLPSNQGTFTAAAKQGFSFDHWELDGATVGDQSGEISLSYGDFELTQGRTANLVAHFAADEESTSSSTTAPTDTTSTTGTTTATTDPADTSESETSAAESTTTTAESTTTTPPTPTTAPATPPSPETSAVEPIDATTSQLEPAETTTENPLPPAETTPTRTTTTINSTAISELPTGTPPATEQPTATEPARPTEPETAHEPQPSVEPTQPTGETPTRTTASEAATQEPTAEQPGETVIAGTVTRTTGSETDVIAGTETVAPGHTVIRGDQTIANPGGIAGETEYFHGSETISGSGTDLVGTGTIVHGTETERFTGDESIGPDGSTRIVGDETLVRGTETDTIHGTEIIGSDGSTEIIGTDTFTGPDGKQTTIVGTETIINGTTVASGTEWVDGTPTPITNQTLVDGTIVGETPSAAAPSVSSLSAAPLAPAAGLGSELGTSETAVHGSLAIVDETTGALETEGFIDIYTADGTYVKTVSVAEAAAGLDLPPGEYRAFLRGVPGVADGTEEDFTVTPGQPFTLEFDVTPTPAATLAAAEIQPRNPLSRTAISAIPTGRTP
jgi:hypothetical protein